MIQLSILDHPKNERLSQTTYFSRWRRIVFLILKAEGRISYAPGHYKEKTAANKGLESGYFARQLEIGNGQLAILDGVPQPQLFFDNIRSIDGQKVVFSSQEYSKEQALRVSRGEPNELIEIFKSHFEK